MGYDREELESQTTKTALFCGTLIILGFFLFLFKSEACKGGVVASEKCKDEFHVIEGLSNQFACSPGARAEFITSPPAPKPGVICHCDSNPPLPPPPPAPR